MRRGGKSSRGRKREGLAQFSPGCMQRAQPGTISAQAQQTQGTALCICGSSQSLHKSPFLGQGKCRTDEERQSQLCSALILPPSLPQEPQRFFVGLWAGPALLQEGLNEETAEQELPESLAENLQLKKNLSNHCLNN